MLSKSFHPQNHDGLMIKDTCCPQYGKQKIINHLHGCLIFFFELACLHARFTFSKDLQHEQAAIDTSHTEVYVHTFKLLLFLFVRPLSSSSTDAGFLSPTGQVRTDEARTFVMMFNGVNIRIFKRENMKKKNSSEKFRHNIKVCGS